MKGRILVVEDHELIAETYKIMLEDQGYDVYMAADGLEGIGKFDEQVRNTESQGADPFDLVVIDYHLPRKDGIEVIEHLLSIAPHQRVLIASSYPIEVIRKSAGILHKPVELLQKPFDLNNLVEIVHGRKAPEIVGVA